MNLSLEDKEAFFGWLDEFFSRYLGVELGPRERGPASSVSATFPVQNTRPPVSTLSFDSGLPVGHHER